MANECDRPKKDDPPSKGGKKVEKMRKVVKENQKVKKRWKRNDQTIG